MKSLTLALALSLAALSALPAAAKTKGQFCAEVHNICSGKCKPGSYCIQECASRTQACNASAEGRFHFNRGPDLCWNKGRC